MEQYVELKNKLARKNGYQDYGDELRERYEDPEFESGIRRLYEEMRPLYVQLHAYIRRKLYETYGSDVVDINGTYLTDFLFMTWQILEETLDVCIMLGNLAIDIMFNWFYFLEASCDRKIN